MLAGDGDGRFKPSLDIEQRFLASVDQSGGIELCWPRDAFEDKDGYTRFWVSSAEAVPAHRWAYDRFVEPIASGLVIDHVLRRGCHGGNCVNWVRHLEPVTNRENQLRSRNTKLTEDVALALYLRWQAGESQRKLATEVGMSQGSLSARFKIIHQSPFQGAGDSTRL